MTEGRLVDVRPAGRHALLVELPDAERTGDLLAELLRRRAAGSSFSVAMTSALPEVSSSTGHNSWNRKGNSSVSSPEPVCSSFRGISGCGELTRW